MPKRLVVRQGVVEALVPDSQPRQIFMSYEHLRGVMGSATAHHNPARRRRQSPTAFEFLVPERQSLRAEPLPVTADQWQDRALVRAKRTRWRSFRKRAAPPAEAKKICLGCEVRHECLDYALAHDERFGIWGAASPSARDAASNAASSDRPLGGQPVSRRRSLGR